MQIGIVSKWSHISSNFLNALINLDCSARNSWSKDFQPYHNGSRCISDRLSLTCIKNIYHRLCRDDICRRCSCGWYCAGAGCCSCRRRRPQRCRCCQRRYKPVTPLLQLTAPICIYLFSVFIWRCAFVDITFNMEYL